MCVCFGRVSLHCFTSCTPGIIYGLISSHCMGVASRWSYNGDCMIKIFQGAGVVTLSKPPLNNFSHLPIFASFTAKRQKGKTRKEATKTENEKMKK